VSCPEIHIFAAVSRPVSNAVSPISHRRSMTTDTNRLAGIPPTSTRSLSSRLDREWAQMCRRPAVVAHVRSWGLTDQPFSTLDEFLRLTGHRVAPTRGADELLGRLVTVAADDPIATRIVLQRILPGLLAIVRTEQQRNPRVDAFDIVIGDAWLSIVSYRVDARPTEVAARILHDARQRSFTHGRRRRVVEEVACDAGVLNEMATEVTTAPFDELVGVLDEARRRGLHDGHVEVVGDLITHGTAVKVAAARQLTTRAVRYRRHHAVAEIRRLVAA